MSNLDLTTFSKQWHANVDYTTGENIISAPLGVWLLLAQAATPAPGNLHQGGRDTLEGWLGMKLETAYQQFSHLLRTTPEAMNLAMGAWADNASFEDDGYKTWLNHLPDQVTTATPIPAKEVLDRWTDKNSFEIIKKFPMTQKALDEASIVLANVLATKFNWSHPFEAVDNTSTTWQAKELLHADDSHQGVRLVHDTDGNLFGVVTNQDDTGVNVYAVIAADKNLPAQQVIAFAEQYAADPVRALNTADIPDNSPIHTATTVQATKDRYEATLPAWTAEATHDLTTLKVPLKPAAAGVTSQPLEGVEGIQVAMAEFNKNGFEAAAVTVMSLRAASLPPRPSAHKKVDIRFEHPFAVVAAQGRVYRQPETPWVGLPVFTAWVATAAEVSDKTFDRPAQ